MPTVDAAEAAKVPADVHAAVTMKPEGVAARPLPVAKVRRALAPDDLPESATAKRTRVRPSHATGALASSTSCAASASGPPGVAGGVSTLSGALARKRYDLAAAYSRYCASAPVGHGAPKRPRPAAQAEGVKAASA
jgi:hypothetical protein